MASVKRTGIRARPGPGGRTVYQVRWYTADGRRMAATYDTLRDAEAARAERLREKRLGGSADIRGGRTRLADWWATWDAGRQVRASTSYRDASLARNWILPAWGATPIGALRPSQVSSWMADLMTSHGLSSSTATRCLQLLTQALDAAVHEGLIANNPAATVPRPAIPDTEARWLTPDELLAVEEAIATTGTASARWHALVVPFVADTGLRLGELAALRVRHVDVLRGTVQVEATTTRSARRPGEPGRRVSTQPKTRAGVRTVPTLTRETGARLAEMLAERRAGADDYLWLGSRGGQLDPTNWRDRIWRPAVRAAGLSEPLPTPHSLRHTWVAHLIAAGVPTYRIARWAGHRTTTTLERVYGHLLVTDEDETRDALAAIRAAATSRSARDHVTELPRR